MLPAFLRRHTSLLFLLGAGIVSGAALYLLRGADAVAHALDSAWRLLLMILPSLGAGLLLAAALRQLLPSGAMARWMGEESGWRGLWLASAAGILTPGGPMAAFPLVLVLAQAGADRGALIAFVLAWALNGFQRVLVWEVPILGADFALLRFLCGLPLPVIAGWIARRLPISWSPADAPGMHGGRAAATPPPPTPR